MNMRKLGRLLADERRRSGLTQAKVAARLRTTQSAVSRMESGDVKPGIDVLDRFAQALGRPIPITLGELNAEPTREELRGRVRRVLGSYVFNPWERGPTASEALSLEADGLTREFFEGT
jgi:transcriptional regulator with XRE-family HTH domain